MKNTAKSFMLCLLAVLFLLLCCDTDRMAPDGKAADTVVYGNIYTAEDNAPKVDAFAVKDGRFIFVGDVGGVEEYIGRKTEIIDYRGKGMVTPGFYESHAHYLMAEGMDAMGALILNETEDTPEIFLEKVKEAYKIAKREGRPGIYAYGWNYQMYEEYGMPTVEEMDEVCPDIPLYASDAEVHKGLANTLCMRNAGIVDETGKLIIGQIRGGEIAVDEAGKATGLLKEQAGTYCRNKGIDFYTMLDEERAKTVVRESQKQLNANGFVSYMDGWANFYANERFYEAANALDGNGKLTMCLGLPYEIESSAKDIDAELNEAFKLSKYESAHVNTHYIKLFMDGTVESGSGYVYTPYRDGTVGEANWKEDEVAYITDKANDKDFTMHIHTMGDRAINEVVNAYVSSGKVSARNTLVHVRNIPEEDFARCAENDIVCVSGLLWHAMSDFVRDYLSALLPKEYLDKAYPMKSYFKSGVVMTSHSDFPALAGSSEKPFYIMEVAVTGLQPVTGQEDKPFWRDEVITRQQALEALTINGAFQMHAEDERGSIKKGKWADFVLVDRDVMNVDECPDNEIHSATVQNTFFEGEMVYDKELGSKKMKS